MMKHITAILCAALVLAGCNNMLVPSDDSHSDLKESGVMITVSGDTANPRTLFPAKNFFKYVLGFSGPQSKSDITLENGETSVLVTGLADGDWTITVKGFVRINGTPYEAAEGSSQIKVSSGQFQNVNIPISAKKDGAKGYFSYSVSFPPSMVDSAELSIRPYNEWDEQFYDVVNNTPETIELAPGYYLMSIRLYNDFQTAGLTEIVHIYSNMETKAEYVLTKSDFAEFITLSGTVNIRVTGVTLQKANVVVYTENGDGYWFADVNADGSWSLRMAPFANNTDLFFGAEIFINDNWFYKDIEGKSITVKDQDSIIALGIVQFNFINLSGTINVTYDGGKVPENVVIVAVDQDGDRIGETLLSLPGVNEPWSIALLHSDTPRNVSFMVQGYDDDYGWQPIFVKYAGNSPVTITNQSVSGININLGDLPHPDKPVSPEPLLEAVWVNGDISESYKVDWYSIDVIKGASYYLWWYEEVDIEVYGWYSNGDYIDSADSTWYEPLRFTANSSGKVYIRVRAWNWWSDTGTYELIYSTASNRPVRGVDNYIVTFDSKGGSPVPPSRNVALNAKLSKPADPDKDGVRFGGWYKEEALTNPWDFATDTVKGKTTLYAKWNPKVPGTIVVAFEGFGDEFIDLSVNTTGSISRSRNQSLEVTVEGADFDYYCQWYLDGSRIYRGWRNYIDIYVSELPIGVHTLSAVVTYNGKPYSKELTFRVVY